MLSFSIFSGVFFFFFFAETEEIDKKRIENPLKGKGKGNSLPNPPPLSIAGPSASTPTSLNNPDKKVRPRTSRFSSSPRTSLRSTRMRPYLTRAKFNKFNNYAFRRNCNICFNFSVNFILAIQFSLNSKQKLKHLLVVSESFILSKYFRLKRTNETELSTKLCWHPPGAYTLCTFSALSN